jgi:cell division cycle 14
MPFNSDFGPLNLAHVHRYCRELARLLNDQKFEASRIFHYCGTHEDKRANAAFLMGCFMIIVLKMDAETAFQKFRDARISFKPFRDASRGSCHYECTIIHCLRGL